VTLQHTPCSGSRRAVPWVPQLVLDSFGAPRLGAKASARHCLALPCSPLPESCPRGRERISRSLGCVWHMSNADDGHGQAQPRCPSPQLPRPEEAEAKPLRGAPGCCPSLGTVSASVRSRRPFGIAALTTSSSPSAGRLSRSLPALAAPRCPAAAHPPRCAAVAGPRGRSRGGGWLLGRDGDARCFSTLSSLRVSQGFPRREQAAEASARAGRAREHPGEARRHLCGELREAGGHRGKLSAPGPRGAGLSRPRETRLGCWEGSGATRGEEHCERG